MQQLVAARVNDCAIKLANVNGTGSASANSLLMESIFRMGIPVSGKNLFPSNIQGLPTWYEIRANKTGYTSRAIDYDLIVAMNAQTYAASHGKEIGRRKAIGGGGRFVDVFGKELAGLAQAPQLIKAVKAALV